MLVVQFSFRARFSFAQGQLFCPFQGHRGCPLTVEFIPTQQAILDTFHFCLDFVIIHALCDLYYPVSMDYTDRLLSNRYHC